MFCSLLFSYFISVPACTKPPIRVSRTHDWSVDQLPDLFHTTHKVKTQQVVKNRGHHCGDIELAGYLSNKACYRSMDTAGDPVPSGHRAGPDHHFTG